ncbi:hypothetical protein M9Y10_023675 [Tritrichomonas musculus]|uniref:CRAL-TRIO domain-containing protein n=1 Tax=Tritrichomonas musculus TaxID=1915356 RepID=A0ABR2KWK5_9EUKA
MIVPIPPDSFITPINILFEDDKNHTTYPIAYIYTKNNKCYLEVPGLLFNNAKDNILNLVLKILIQIAINQAKNIRMIISIKYSIFEAGLSEFHQIEQELRNFISFNDLPIFFLFNQFDVTRSYIDESFIFWSEKDKNEVIKKEIERIFHMINTCFDSYRKLTTKRIIEKAKKIENIPNDQVHFERFCNIQEIRDILDHDEEFQQIKQQYKYIMMLKNSFSKGYYGYIDPTSSESIERLVKDISKLPEIDPKYFIFNNDNTDRSNFDQIFLNKIIKDIEMMKQLKFSKQYTEETLTSLISTINANLQHKNEILSQIENHSPNKFSIKYFEEEIAIKKIELTKAIQNLEENQEKMENILNSYHKYGNYEIWNDDYTELIGFLSYKKINKNIEKDKMIKLTDSLETAIDKSNKKQETLISYTPIIHLRTGPLANLANHSSEHIMLLTFPRNNDPTTIDSMKKNVEEIKEQIRYLKADLIILQRSSQSQLQEKLKIYISNIKQNLDHLKKIKKCVEHINFNFNDNANLKSRLDNIRKNNHIIHTIYKDYSKNPILDEFINLYDQLESENKNTNNINIDSLISYGIIIFNLVH